MKKTFKHGGIGMYSSDEKIWNCTDLFCMGCANKMVFECMDSECDYGGGNLHKCLTCGFSFYGYVENQKTPDFLLEQLKAKACE